jgi:hypothetical protein
MRHCLKILPLPPLLEIRSDPYLHPDPKLSKKLNQDFQKISVGSTKLPIGEGGGDEFFSGGAK